MSLKWLSAQSAGKNQAAAAMMHEKSLYLQNSIKSK